MPTEAPQVRLRMPTEAPQARLRKPMSFEKHLRMVQKLLLLPRSYRLSAAALLSLAVADSSLNLRLPPCSTAHQN